MGRGRWTYHRTYKTGCCGGPGCIIMLLTVPFWPIINGLMVIKDTNMTSPVSTIQKEIDVNTQELLSNDTVLGKQAEETNKSL